MDDHNTVDVVNSIDRPVLSFGIREEAHFRAVNVAEYKPGFYEFDVLELGEPFAHIRLSVPGYHNIYNAPGHVLLRAPPGPEAGGRRTGGGGLPRHGPPV